MTQQGVFASIPFQSDGGFPQEIKCWCTECKTFALVINHQTNEKFGLMTFEWVDGKKVFIFDDGQRWPEELLRQHWKPFVCH